MFTGLIEATGAVRRSSRHSSGARLELEVEWPENDHPLVGDSVAVNGACLTVLEPAARGFAADLSPETLSRTLLGELRVGETVNLERALKLGGRIGGHLVQGHVDAVVRLLAIVAEGRFARWRLSLPRELRHQVAHKGSICVHGVSLTIASLNEDSFEVALIPDTLDKTVLGQLRQGARLHLETDVLAKYVARHLEGESPSLIEQVFGTGVDRA